MLVTIGGQRFSTTIGSMKGIFKIPISAERRALLGATAGDELHAELEVDAAPPTTEVPTDLGDALAGDPGAAAFFDSLTPSQQKGFVVSIESAKTAETRAKRAEKALAALGAGLKRP